MNNRRWRLKAAKCVDCGRHISRIHQRCQKCRIIKAFNEGTPVYARQKGGATNMLLQAPHVDLRFLEYRIGSPFPPPSDGGRIIHILRR